MRSAKAFSACSCAKALNVLRRNLCELQLTILKIHGICRNHVGSRKLTIWGVDDAVAHKT